MFLSGFSDVNRNSTGTDVFYLTSKTWQIYSIDDLKWNVRIFIFKAHMKLGSQIKYFECCLTNKNTQYVIFPQKRIQFIKSVLVSLSVLFIYFLPN